MIDADLTASLEFAEYFKTHDVIIKRPQDDGTDSSGGAKRKYVVVVAREPCSIQPAGANNVEFFDQQNIAVSHEVIFTRNISFGSDVDMGINWLLETAPDTARPNAKTRWFLVKSATNPGELDVFCTAFCEEIQKHPE